MIPANGMADARREFLDWYENEGFKLVLVSRQTKKPVDAEWQMKRRPLEEVVAWVRRGGDIGVQVGEVSGWLCAGDMDCREAELLAPRFLPDTLKAGKGDTPSHYFYRSPGLGFAKFKDLSGDTIMDLKASNDGAGHQVVVEPSVHLSKGPYRWVGGFNPAAIAHVEARDLRGAMGCLAVAVLVARHLPDRGRHDLAMALAGYMLRNGTSPGTVLEILTAAWEVKDASREALRDLEGIVRDTAARIERSEPITGGRTLEELSAGMPSRIAKFLEWERPYTREGSGEDEEKKRRNQADRLIDYALESGAELFADQAGAPHALVDGEALPLHTGAYKWLRTLMWDREGISVGGEALKTATGTLAAFAARGGKVRELHTRSAWHEGAVYYRLDKGRVVRIGRDGWRREADPPVVFRTVPNLKPLPNPERGGSLDELEDLINLKTDRDKRLLKAYAATVALPHIARPILQTTGVMGSGKTTASRVMKRTFDPTAPETVRADPRDFLQKASHSYIVMLDNQNSLPEWAVDTICRLVTGEGDSKRSLYTDDEDFIYEMRRAILLNGINPPTDRGDAQDRTLPVELERIPDRDRRSEEDLWDRFAAGHGRLLGAAFDALAGALQARETLRLSRRPRLADWGEYAASVYEALGWGSERFLKDWAQVVKVQNQGTLDGSPVAQAVLSFMESRSRYAGLASTLHAKLEAQAEELNINVKLDKAWPKSPRWLWRRMKEVLPLLTAMGVSAHQEHTEMGSEIVLEKHGDPPAGGPDNTDAANVSSNVRSSDPYLSGPDNTDVTDNINGHFTYSLPQTEAEKGQKTTAAAKTARKAPTANVSDISNAGGTLEEYLDDPPNWLASQLARCAGDVRRWIKPTSSAIAQDFYGKALRASEVEPVLRRWLENGGGR